MAYVAEAHGKWSNEVIPTKSGTAYVAGELIYHDGTDNVPATPTTEVLKGFVVEAKAAAANTNPIVIRVPKSLDATFYAEIGNGTIAATDVGKSFDLSSSTTINASATDEVPVTLVRFISSTKGEFKFNYQQGTDGA